MGCVKGVKVKNILEKPYAFSDCGCHRGPRRHLIALLSGLVVLLVGYGGGPREGSTPILDTSRRYHPGPRSCPVLSVGVDRLVEAGGYQGYGVKDILFVYQANIVYTLGSSDSAAWGARV